MVTAKLRLLLAGLSVAGMVATGLVVVAPAQSANAISGSDFHAGYLITDAAFYDANAMSQADISAVLAAKEGNCTAANCLRNYKTDTTSKPEYVSTKTGKLVCKAYAGALQESAAAVIFETQVACGVSAKVILTMLQKESGLVTAVNPTDGTLDRAMGYDCPNVCNPASLGFFNQLYGGVRQLKTYRDANYGNYQLGTYPIPFGDPPCAAPAVRLWNYATAALYNYTPLQPDAAALVDVYSNAGDSCSAYGNRNFWVIYHDWFGSSTTLALDGVQLPRIDGTDRYETAAAIALNGYPQGAPVVYVATGMDYPDALSAAPAAAKQGGPLLLVRPTSVPPAVSAAISALKPELIVVVGGIGVVSDAVYSQLEALQPNIRRDWGNDRYDTSRTVTQKAFDKFGASMAYIATGTDFPDALSASAAAGASSAPVVLVDGEKTGVDTSTSDLLHALGVSKVKIAGGSAVVSDSIKNALSSSFGAGNVTRLSGNDRYQTSEAINRDAFSSSSAMYLASGLAYPDALAGAAVAGAQKAPLYVIPPTCSPFGILEDVTSFGASRVVLLGGPGALSPSVEGEPCD